MQWCRSLLAGVHQWGHRRSDSARSGAGAGRVYRGCGRAVPGEQVCVWVSVEGGCVRVEGGCLFLCGCGEDTIQRVAACTVCADVCV